MLRRSPDNGHASWPPSAAVLADAGLRTVPMQLRTPA